MSPAQQPTEADWADFAAWSDRDLTALREGIAARDERIQKLREALEQIAAIEDKMYGPDWEEIEEARAIARKALDETGG